MGKNMKNLLFGVVVVTLGVFYLQSMGGHSEDEKELQSYTQIKKLTDRLNLLESEKAKDKGRIEEVINARVAERVEKTKGEVIDRAERAAESKVDRVMAALQEKDNTMRQLEKQMAELKQQAKQKAGLEGQGEAEARARQAEAERREQQRVAQEQREKENQMPPWKNDPDPAVERKRRAEAVKEAFNHAWTGYRKHAWGQDELLPLSRRGKNWASASLGMTIMDATSTMWLMGMTKEFEDCVKWITETLDFGRGGSISVFEANIRYVGGLLSAYELSGEKYPGLLAKAKDLGDRLITACHPVTGLPQGSVHLGGALRAQPHGGGGRTILSEAGTLQLEWRTLSYHTKDDKYDKMATLISHTIDMHLPQDGLAPTMLDRASGRFTSNHVTLGALGDSYFEYIIKQYLLTGKTEEKYRKKYEVVYKSILNKMVKKTNSGLTYVAELMGGRMNSKMDHLACFTGGMLAIGAHELGGDDREEVIRVAGEITETCHQSYKRAATGIGPEVMTFPNNNDLVLGSPSYYILRPETVESYFYMWRITGDTKWQEYGWEMFRALNHTCRVGSGGFGGLKNVNQMPPMKDDLMQSFVMAETFKYLYLLFADESVLPLSGWVFNTEAHPLKIRKRTPTKFDFDYEETAKKAMEAAKKKAELKAVAEEAEKALQVAKAKAEEAMRAAREGN